MELNLTTLAIALASTALISGHTAWQVQDWRYGQIAAEQTAAANEIRLRNERVARSAATSHEQAKAIIHTKFVRIKEYVKKDTYINRSCLNDDGVRSVNLATEATGVATKSEGAVSATEPAK